MYLDEVGSLCPTWILSTLPSMFSNRFNWSQIPIDQWRQTRIGNCIFLPWVETHRNRWRPFRNLKMKPFANISMLRRSYSYLENSIIYFVVSRIEQDWKKVLHETKQKMWVVGFKIIFPAASSSFQHASNSNWPLAWNANRELHLFTVGWNPRQ